MALRRGACVTTFLHGEEHEKSHTNKRWCGALGQPQRCGMEYGVGGQDHVDS